MLTIVELVLQAQPTLKAFESDSGVICSFLGPAPGLSLADACAIGGSTKLLDWIWRTAGVPRGTGWSLNYFLRSDRFYYNWQFAKALATAAARGDIKTTEWLSHHFTGCKAGEEAVEAAADSGQLHCLNYLWELNQQGTVRVEWGRNDMDKAARNGHSEVVRWLFEHTRDENATRDVDRVIKTALWSGDVELAEFLAPRGRNILDYTSDCPNRSFIERMLARGDLQRDPDRLDDAIGNAARLGDLELLQRIVQHCTQVQRGWYRAVQWAAKRCDLQMLQWLLKHPVCRRLFVQVIRNRDTYRFLLVPCEKENYEVLQYLYEQGAKDDFGEVMLRAVGRGQHNMVKWLLKHFSYEHGCDGHSVMDEAAKCGRVDMLEFFQGLNTTADERTKWWLPSAFAMPMAAKNGHLAVVKWLHANRSEGSSAFAMDYAAEYGHIEILKWLHENRTEGCTEYAIGMATRNGHLHVVDWLRNHYPHFTPHTFGLTGHEDKLFDILLYLQIHYPDMFTTEFIRQLGWDGDVGKWLVETHRDLKEIQEPL